MPVKTNPGLNTTGISVVVNSFGEPSKDKIDVIDMVKTNGDPSSKNIIDISSDISCENPIQHEINMSDQRHLATNSSLISVSRDYSSDDVTTTDDVTTWVKSQSTAMDFKAKGCLQKKKSKLWDIVPKFSDASPP